MQSCYGKIKVGRIFPHKYSKPKPPIEERRYAYVQKKPKKAEIHIHSSDGIGNDILISIFIFRPDFR